MVQLGTKEMDNVRDTHGEEGEPWYGFDLDGTLAIYDGWKGIEHIGRPIQPMVDRAKQLHSQGKKVKIFTARVAPKLITAKENSEPGFGETGQSEFGEAFVWRLKKHRVGMSPDDYYKVKASDIIKDWCREHLGFVPEVTCEKDQLMKTCYDDRSVQVVENKGMAILDIAISLCDTIEGISDTGWMTAKEWNDILTNIRTTKEMLEAQRELEL